MFKRQARCGNKSGLIIAFVVGLLATASYLALAAPPSFSSVRSEVAHKAALAHAYGQLPMSFEANSGQTASEVKFISRGNGYGLFLTGSEAVLTLRNPNASIAATKSRKLKPFGIAPGSNSGTDSQIRQQASAMAKPGCTTDIVRMQLLGVNTKVEPVGVDQLPGTSNYFRGSDPAKWRTNVPNFSKVRYPGIYPGVDLVYYGNQQQLEYDFVLSPEADSRAIRLHFAGAKQLALSADGDLSIHAENGSITFHRPSIYQMDGARRQPISGQFKLLADNSVGFSLGRYDHAKALVIDPILAYSTYFGGTNAEYVVAVAADASGNAYVTGLTISEDFPLTAGAFQAVDYATPSNAVSTAFVSKFNASGTALLYSTYLGGVAIADTEHEQGDYGKAIAVDSAGNAYVTGYTYSTDFPVTSTAFQKGNQAVNHGNATGFVTKLNASGTALLYSTYLGGSVLDELTAIAIDTSGDAYISGLSFSSDYPTTSGAFQKTNNSFSSGGFNDVVTKLNPTGSALIYSTFLGGGSSDGSDLSGIYWTNPIAVDSAGDAYVGGFTKSGNFPVSSTAYQKTNHGSINVTISKLNPAGSALLYSTYLGGSTDSIIEGLGIDSAGNAYVAGYTSDTDFPVTTGAYQTVNKADTNTAVSADSNQNGFLTKINPTGTALVYSTYLGGTTGPWGGDQIYDLKVDSAGDAYVAGSAMSDDFPVTTNAFQAKNKGATHCCDYLTYTSNGFLTEVNPAGTALLYSSYIGGSGTQNPEGPGGSGDSAYGLGLGPNGNVYVVGFTTSSNFPLTVGAFETKYKTQQNTGFVADFDLGAAPTSKATETTLTPSAATISPGAAVSFTASVKPASGTVVPTGSVVFSIDEVTKATIALNSSGNAVYSTTGLAAGQHYVVASYGGSTTYEPSGDGFNEIVAPLKPVITPPAGTYTSQQTVTITESTAASPVYFTLDGSKPSVFSTPYTAPIIVNLSKTVSAVAIAAHDAPSTVVTNAYTIIGSPAVLAGPATAIATPKATLNAFVNTLGLAGSYYFRYGTSSTALTANTAKVALAASKTRVSVSTALSTLAAKTTYYYQVVVTTNGGTTSGAILSFTTN